MPHLQIRLLGTFSLVLDGAPLAAQVSGRAQDLIVWLLLHRSAPTARTTLAAALWPETNDEQALKNLRTLLVRLRTTLPEIDPYIQIDSQSLRWRDESFLALDVADFEAALRIASGAHKNGQQNSAAEALTRAVDLYTGDLLPGRYDEWLLPERDRLRQGWLGAQEELIALLEAQRKPRRALEAAQRLLRADPLRESAYAACMRCELTLGDRAAALRTYHACASHLRDELGVDPGAATQAVYERVLLSDSVPDATAIEGPPTAPAVPPVARLAASGPLVGRAATMEWLKERRQDALSGHAHIALVLGEAGIGKTRAAEELLAWVERQGGSEIVVARCYAGGAGVAYSPVADWLRSGAVAQRVRRAGTAWRSEVARLLPELLAEYPEIPPPEPITQTWQTHRFYRALAAAFSGEGSGDTTPAAPLLLLLEDIQWADSDTLGWLPFLLNAAAGKRLLLLATLREEETEEHGPLFGLRQTLLRSGQLHERRLRPLNQAETSELAASLVNPPAASEGSTALMARPVAQPAEERAKEASERLFRDSEGNPLFIVEMVRAGPGGQSPGEEGTAFDVPSALNLPPRVLATIRHRLGQLSEQARALAEHAAVLGRAFQYDVLALCSRQNEDQIVLGLDELWRRQIVREQGADAYDFSHDKLRQVAYAGLGSARRRLLHRRAAEALLQLHGDETALCAQIATHFEQAGERKQAALHFRRAADAARDVYANAEAIRLYRHVLSNELAPTLSRQESFEALHALGKVLTRINHLDDALETYRALAAEAFANHDDLWAARAHYEMGLALTLAYRYGEASAALEQARSLFESLGERRELARTQARISGLWTEKANYPEAQKWAEASIAISTEIEDQEGLISALCYFSSILWLKRDLLEARAAAEKALALAEAIDYKEGIREATISIGNSFGYEEQESTRWLLRSALIAREMGDYSGLSGTRVNLAYDQTEHGEYLTALALVLEAARDAAPVGECHDLCAVLHYAGRILGRMGRAREGEGLVRLAIPNHRTLGISRFLIAAESILAVLLLDQGRADEAAQVLAQARADNAFMPDATTNQLRNSMLTLGEVRAGVALGTLDADATHARLDALLIHADPDQAAEIAWWRWRLLGGEENRLVAAAQLREVYMRHGRALARHWYAELTGELLPEAPPLPDVSALITTPLPDVDTFLAEIGVLVRFLPLPALEG